MERFKSLNKLSDQKKGSLLAFVAVMFITPDSLLIRLSDIETWGMLFYRGAIPFVIVLIGLLLFYRQNFINAFLKVGTSGIDGNFTEEARILILPALTNLNTCPGFSKIKSMCPPSN